MVFAPGSRRATMRYEAVRGAPLCACGGADAVDGGAAAALANSTSTARMSSDRDRRKGGFLYHGAHRAHGDSKSLSSLRVLGVLCGESSRQADNSKAHRPP